MFCTCPCNFYLACIYLLCYNIFIGLNQSDLQGHVPDLNDVKALALTLITRCPMHININNY